MIKLNENDYFEFKGIKLSLELMNSGSDNKDRQVDIFLDNIVDFVYDYMNNNFVRQKI